jgi:hypothetical protein
VVEGDEALLADARRLPRAHAEQVVPSRSPRDERSRYLQRLRSPMWEAVIKSRDERISCRLRSSALKACGRIWGRE